MLQTLGRNPQKSDFCTSGFKGLDPGSNPLASPMFPSGASEYSWSQTGVPSNVDPIHLATEFSRLLPL